MHDIGIPIDKLWLGIVYIVLAIAIGIAVVKRCRKPDIHGDYP